MKSPESRGRKEFFNRLSGKIRGAKNSGGEEHADSQRDTKVASKAPEAMTGKRRNLTGRALLLVNLICFSMTLFQLYIAGPGNLVANISRAIHLGYGMCIVFLLCPATKKSSIHKIAWFDFIFALAGVVVNLYIVVNFQELNMRAGLVTKTDLYLGILLILLLLECSRRVVGPVLTGIAAFFLIYTVYGQYFPEAIAHRGVSVTHLVRHMYLTLEGIYGIALGVSTNFIFLFILMGAVLTYMGTGEFLIDLAICAFGRQRGGPAKAAVVSSAMFGVISGSSVANVCTTGTFTIPLMKRTGYRPFFAGSVEAAASTGGQIMPPVMGAAAFIIAENLGQPYLMVCAAAALPALLYFAGIFFAVHQEAVRTNLQGLPPEEIPKFRHVAKRAYLLIPLIVIILIMVLGFSPAYAGLMSILSAIGLSWLRKETRYTPKKLFFAFADGAKNAIDVLIACATVGFIIGSFTLSGMGLRLASLVVQIGGGHLLPTLMFTALASLVLGMGVPTTANYVMISMITTPAIVSMGVLPMSAHLFCFYYGIVSDLTPPVALASLAGAGLAGAKFWPTAINATKLGISAYIAPFFFVYHPLLLLGQVPFEPMLLLNIVFAFGGLMILSCGLFGFVLVKAHWYERIILVAAGLATFFPEPVTSFIGAGVFGIIYFFHRIRRQRQRVRDRDT
ncbi:MAG: TRAP transporter permease [candidate division WOR-3 bacterium]